MEGKTHNRKEEEIKTKIKWSAQIFKLLSEKCWNISCRAVYETRTYGSTRGK